MNPAKTGTFCVLVTFLLGISVDVTYADKAHAFLWTSANGMQDLGTLGSDYSEATAINDDGVVVGWSWPDQVSYHAFSWTAASGMIDLGTLPGFRYSQAFAINAAGNIVGMASTNNIAVPFFWSADGGFVDLLGTVSSTAGSAQGINDSDEVTGWIRTDDGVTNAFIWSASLGLRFLGHFEDSTFAQGWAINNRSHITGTSDRGVVYHAFVWSHRIIRMLTRNQNYRGLAINDSDDVVGAGADGGFYWSASTGVATRLRTLGGTSAAGRAINENRAIAGSSLLARVGNDAALWSDPHGDPQDLGLLPGGSYSVANGLNNFNEVVGVADVP